MSISMMKIADEYLGRVLVYFITLFKKLRLKKIKNTNETKNILFIKFWGIGSIVLTAPSVKKVKSAYPGAKIYFLTLKDNLELCRELNFIDETIAISIANPFAFISGLINAICTLRKTNFNIIFDFEFYTYFSAVISAAIKSQSSIGFDNLKSNRKHIYTKTIVFNDGIHTRDNFLNLVDIDSKVKNINTSRISFPDKGFDKNINSEIRFIVNVNASKLAFERRLPKEMFIGIIDHITNFFKSKVILIGSTDECEYVQEVFQQVSDKNSVDNLCGKTTMRQLLNLIKSSHCLITNDSGPLHIASMFNTPVIAFFGPESPKRYGPLSTRKLVLYNDIHCSPCMSISNLKTVNCIYDSPKCMQQFNIKDVVNKIDLFLNDILDLDKRIILEKTEKIF